MSWSVSLATCPWFMTAAGFLVGACLGRLANRCIDVFPRHEALSGQLRAVGTFARYEDLLRRARSWWHWFPVVGWLFPGNPLAGPGYRWRLVAVELAGGVLLALLAWSRTLETIILATGAEMAVPPISLAASAWPALAPPAGMGAWLVRLLWHGLLLEALLVASVIDLRLMIIPDGATVPLMMLSVLIGGLSGGAWLVPVWYEHTGLVAALSGSMGTVGFGQIVVPDWIAAYPHGHGLAVSIAGLIVGGGTVWAVRLVGHWALGREAMGFGDVMLMALVGSVIGWQPVLVVFFLAPVCAIVVLCLSLLTGKYREFPYGPWLSLATVLLLVGWSSIWPAVGQIFLLGRYVPWLGVGGLLLLAILLLGMRLLRGGYDFPAINEFWTSGDQLAYLSMENPNPENGLWEKRRVSVWAGLASSRGRQGESQWHGIPDDGAIGGSIAPDSHR